MVLVSVPLPSVGVFHTTARVVAQADGGQTRRDAPIERLLVSCALRRHLIKRRCTDVFSGVPCIIGSRPEITSRDITKHAGRTCAPSGIRRAVRRRCCLGCDIHPSEFGCPLLLCFSYHLDSSEKTNTTLRLPSVGALIRQTNRRYCRSLRSGNRCSMTSQKRSPICKRPVIRPLLNYKSRLSACSRKPCRHWADVAASRRIAATSGICRKQASGCPTIPRWSAPAEGCRPCNPLPERYSFSSLSD